MHQSTWDQEILHGDRSLEAEQLLIRQRLQKIKKSANMEGGLKLKFIFYFKDTTHKSLHIEEWSFV
jgi:hypothetical protein